MASVVYAMACQEHRVRTWLAKAALAATAMADREMKASLLRLCFRFGHCPSRRNQSEHKLLIAGATPV